MFTVYRKYTNYYYKLFRNLLKSSLHYVPLRMHYGSLRFLYLVVNHHPSFAVKGYEPRKSCKKLSGSISFCFCVILFCHLPRCSFISFHTVRRTKARNTASNPVLHSIFTMLLPSGIIIEVPYSTPKSNVHLKMVFRS